MARFLLISRGTYGDVNPFLGLGCALKSRGHEVLVVVNEYFRDHVTKAGLDFAANGTIDAYLEEQAANTALLLFRTGRLPISEWRSRIVSSPQQLERFHVPEFRRSYDLIRDYAARGEVTVAARSWVYAARAAQETLGLRVATIYLSPLEAAGLRPGIFRKLPLSKETQKVLYERVSSRAIDAIMGFVYRKQFEAVYAHMGFRPDGLVTRWTESPLMALALWPDFYVDPEPTWSAKLRRTGFILFDAGEERLEDDVEKFIADRGQKTVVFTEGTFRQGGSSAFLKACADVCSKLGCRGIVLSDCSEAVAHTVPPSLLVKKYVPLGKLLPRVDAFVHHGGMGTVARALHAGIPQLIVPVMGDQSWNAKHLPNMGVARALTVRQFVAGRGIETVRELLTSDRIRGACEARRALIDPDLALRTAADALEELASS